MSSSNSNSSSTNSSSGRRAVDGDSPSGQRQLQLLAADANNTTRAARRAARAARRENLLTASEQQGTPTEAEAAADPAPALTDSTEVTEAEGDAADEFGLKRDVLFLLVSGRDDDLDPLEQYPPDATEEERLEIRERNVARIRAYSTKVGLHLAGPEAEAAAPIPAHAPAPSLAQQALAQVRLENDTALAEQQAAMDQFDADLGDVQQQAAPRGPSRLQQVIAQRKEDTKRRRAEQLTEFLEGQTVKVQTIVQLCREMEQAAAGSGDGKSSAALPAFNPEEILAQIDTDLAVLLHQQQQQQQGGDVDEIWGRYRERDAVLNEVMAAIRAQQEEQMQQEKREKERKRQEQVDDLTAALSNLQVEMTALREQNITLTGQVGQLREQNTTLTGQVDQLRGQNAVLSADLVAVRAQVLLLEGQLAGTGGKEEEKKEEEDGGQQE